MLRTGARLAGEPNEPSVPIDLATERVKPDAARLQDGGLRRPAPAVQRSKPRDELGELERLGEVVVGAQLEPRDLLAQPAGRGEHQDRRGAVPPGEDAAHVVAVGTGDVSVDDQDVVVVDIDHHPRGVAVMSQVGRDRLRA